MAIPHRRLAPVLGPLLALGLAFGWAAAPWAAPGPTSAAEAHLSAWRGGIDLYRAGTFTTQKSWLWCTAADVQIVRNIVDHQHDHSTTAQRTYFDWMRRHNRYRLPLSGGVDPQGWAAGMRHFVDARYRLVASATFDGALRSAVEHLRLTNLPVALAVSHGNHGWVLTGFTATADPARTKAYTVTSVRVVGPLFGLQSKNGYDMPPDTKLTVSQLRGFFTPWKYKPLPMIWDGRYVSIQPIPTAAAATTTAPRAPAPTATPTPSPRPTPTASPSPSPATASPSMVAPPAAAVAAASAPPDHAVAALSTPAAASAPAADRSTADALPVAGMIVAGAGIAVLAALAVGTSARRRIPRSEGSPRS
jgi:hypothetical protein